MGQSQSDVPVIDTVGPHVELISGVLFERQGDHVVISAYLESMVAGVLTREIVNKDAMTFRALAQSMENAKLFMIEQAEHPRRLETVN